jgi:acetyl esterase/lipase
VSGWLVCPNHSRGADDAFQQFSGITYVKRGDRELKAEVCVPRGSGPFPAVLVVHGGAWRAGSRYQLFGAASTLAEHGYTTVSIEYRLAPKYPFPAQIEDCKSAVRWMRTLSPKYKIDPARVGGYGYSAGAHLVTLLGATDPADGLEGPDAKKNGPSTRLQAVAAGGTPCDFQLLPKDSELLAYWLGGTRGQKPDVYRRASPLSFVTADDPPMFIFHGEQDAVVPLLSATALAAKLKLNHVDVESYTVPKAGHLAAMFDDEALDRTVKFFDRTLKAKADQGDAKKTSGKTP